MKQIEEILPDLKRICDHLTKYKDISNDLQQEVLLELLEMPKDKLENITHLKQYVMKKVYMMYLSKSIIKGKYYNTKSFYYRFRHFNALSLEEDISEYHNIESMFDQSEQSDEQSAKDAFQEILSSNKLTALEKDILKEYVRRNCKISQYAKDAEVSRYQLDSRINSILEKCKTIL